MQLNSTYGAHLVIDHKFDQNIDILHVEVNLSRIHLLEVLEINRHKYLNNLSQ